MYSDKYGDVEVVIYSSEDNHPMNNQINQQTTDQISADPQINIHLSSDIDDSICYVSTIYDGREGGISSYDVSTIYDSIPSNDVSTIYDDSDCGLSIYDVSTIYDGSDDDISSYDVSTIYDGSDDDISSYDVSTIYDGSDDNETGDNESNIPEESCPDDFIFSDRNINNVLMCLHLQYDKDKVGEAESNDQENDADDELDHTNDDVTVKEVNSVALTILWIDPTSQKE
jgi:hypothetical protein